MWNDNLLYILFLIQIFYISFHFPHSLLRQMRLVIELHPQSKYPKLYPVSVEVLEIWMKRYLGINYLILCLGLFIVAYGAITGVEEMLGINSLAVVFSFFMLQYMPMLMLEFSSFKYLRKMREANTQTKRTADLSPRKLSDYFDPKWVFITIASHFFFIGLIVFFIYNPFKGFGGTTNLVVLFLTDLFFISLIAWHVYGKKRDPYQAKEDRVRVIKNIARGMFITSNLVVAFVSFSLINKAYGSPELKESAMVFYFIILAIISLRSMLVDVKKVNFDVYKANSDDA